jgi:natural product biosynthesis luciferase-like monooxygenase protein
MTRQSALIIGNESLTHSCAEAWLTRGHGIAVVVTRNAPMAAWAKGLGLRVEAPGPGLAARLGGLHFDWVLSIANLSVIPKAVLALARKGAVNFHDGPLPAHAGLNAPVWALLAGEAQHGITWHLMTEDVDGGDILEQRLFSIGASDTALTLNARAYAAALDSFPALMDQLAQGLRRIPQDLTRRHLHLRNDRPAAFGRVDWSQTADQVARLVRALDHGPYWNPLTTAKIVTSAGVLNVGTAEVVPGQARAGVILARDAGVLVVACAVGAVRLSRLTCQRGLSVTARGIPDTILGPIGADEGRYLTEILAAIAPHDAHHRRQLSDLRPISFGEAAGDTPMWARLPLRLEGVGAQHRLGLLALAIARLGGQATGDLALCEGASPAPGYASDWVPLRVDLTGTVDQAMAGITRTLADARKAPSFAHDLLTRDAALAGLKVPPVGICVGGAVPGTTITLGPDVLHVDTTRLPLAAAQVLADRLTHLVGILNGAARDSPVLGIPALLPAEMAAEVTAPNQTLALRDPKLCIHTAFDAQVDRTPNAVAISFAGTSLTYAGLTVAANRAAHVLIQMGVGPGTLVGLHTRRGLDLVIGALAILKAGGAYVPMDPTYPADRTALFIKDSACPVIVTESALEPSLPQSVKALCLDTDARLADAPGGNPESGVTPADLAYLIYTSGSTGRPKGVMVEHRNVVNFFTGMDQRIGAAPGVWLAVTSLSFDISVLEVFWTLARGFKVVISADDNRALVASGPVVSDQRMPFSIYYWGNDDGQGDRKYHLLLEGARFADANGFCAVWTPERHFHAFGGPYPNPAVTGAAVAAVTKNIGVRAGSCVVPLHHPARIAEDWAVIDNLTGGRAGLAMASGWHPDDFVLRPENAPPHNKAAMFAAADQVRALWRGEGVDFPAANGGTFTVRTQPRPISRELPLWITTAGNPDTWREAGAIGANVLTHLLGQSIDEVSEKIVLYHAALRDAGHDSADFTVTLMLHTYVADTRNAAREMARGPMKDYLRSAAGLIKQYAWAFPAFKKPQGAVQPVDIDIGSLSADELEAILDFAFQRYFDESGLFGTIDDAVARVEQLKRIGVGEVACLIDYGIDDDTVLAGLRPLADVVARANQGTADDDYSIAAELVRHGVTHLQCTPSMARMIVMNDDCRTALRGLKTIMLGGEALPGALVSDLRAASDARIVNMYGPTETTIWSSVDEVGVDDLVANIGTPLANQQMYVLDTALTPVPSGTAGELWIGGDGVTRGYWQRPDLTAERFRPDPFVTPDRAAPWGARMYGTGDVVRRRADGRLDFLGRADHQIKLRGYRIELGEIEAVLEAQPGVTQAVVLAREDVPGDLRLVAYVTGGADTGALRNALAAALPGHMIPAHFVTMAALPLTPNRKVDRKALPAPLAAPPAAQGRAAQDQAVMFKAPQGDVAADIAAIWARVLGVQTVGASDNFFALGGHSLLAVQVHRELRDKLGATKLSITDIFRFPTLSALAAYLGGDAAAVQPAKPQVMTPTGLATQANVRADAMARRRAMRAGQTDG